MNIDNHIYRNSPFHHGLCDFALEVGNDFSNGLAVIKGLIKKSRLS